jgi:hypothetical protein
MNIIRTHAIEIPIPVLVPALLLLSIGPASISRALAEGSNAKTINPNKPAAKIQALGLNPFLSAK